MQAAPPESDLALIAEDRAEVRATADADQRRALAESVIDRRRRLLESWPESPQRADWLLDQAEDLLLLLLPSDGSDLMALFGRPPDAERRRTADVLNEALACLRESAAERSRPRSGAAPTRRDEVLRREALLRGLALARQAECSEGDASTMQRQEAVAALTPLIDELEPAGRPLGQVSLALALSGLGRHDDALALLKAMSSDQALDRLWTELSACSVLRRAGDRREASRRLTRLAAEAGDRDLFTRLLVADGQARLLSEGSDPLAWTPYRSLLEHAAAADRPALRPILLARTAAAAPGGAVQGDSPPFVQLAHLLQGPPSLDALAEFVAREDLPPMERAMAALALGEALLRDGQARPAADVLLDAARRDRGRPESVECLQLAAQAATSLWRASPEDAERRRLARVVYETILKEFPDLPDLDAWRLHAASLALADGRDLDARALVGAIPVDSPQRASGSLLAVEGTAAAARRAPEAERWSRWRTVLGELDALETADPGAHSSSDANARILLRAEALLGSDEPQAALHAISRLSALPPAQDAHAWRLTVEALIAAGRLDEAVDRARRRIESGSANSTVRVLAALLRQAEQTCVALEDEDRVAEASALGRRLMLPLATALREALIPAPAAALDPVLGASARLLAARGLLRGGRPRDALDLLDDLFRSQPDVLEHVIAKAEALRAIGASAPVDEQALADAMLLLKRVAAARRESRDRAFWLAETLQLEILRQLGRNTEQIAPRVEQLRHLDPQLGGPGWKSRLERAALGP